MHSDLPEAAGKLAQAVCRIYLVAAGLREHLAPADGVDQAEFDRACDDVLSAAARALRPVHAARTSPAGARPLASALDYLSTAIAELLGILPPTSPVAAGLLHCYEQAVAVSRLVNP